MQPETDSGAARAGSCDSWKARTLARLCPVGLLILLAGLTFVSRWLLRCDYLLTWDTVQAAAAISHYDVALHMPHPPGEPVYVALLRLIRPLAASPHHAVLLVASAADAVAILLILACASTAVSRRTGIIAAVMFLVSPLAWHSATLGMTFGLDVCLSAAIGLVVIHSVRRPTDGRAMLLAGLMALALGIRCNVNWAGMSLLPLCIYGLWKLSWTGKVKAALVFTAVLAVWAVPAAVWGASQPGYLAAVASHFAEASWRPSALGEAIGGSIAAAVKAYVGAVVQYAIAAIQALGAAAMLLPTVLIPRRRRDRDPIEAIPWRLLLIWMVPTLLLMAAGAYHAEEYVAVALPPLMILASIGALRAALLLRLVFVRFGLPRQAPADRLERSFAITHVLVFCMLNVFLFTVLLWKDPDGGRTLGGRSVASARAQLGHADHPRELLAPSVRTIARRCASQKALIVANHRLEFLVYSLYVPDQLCLYACNRGGAPIAIFAKNHRFTFHQIGKRQDVAVAEGVKLVIATEKLGDETFQVSNALTRIPLKPHDELVLGGMHVYSAGPGRLRLRRHGELYQLCLGEPAEGQPARVARADAVGRTGDRQ